MSLSLSLGGGQELALPRMAMEVYSPTVDLGRDFELLIKRCIEENKRSRVQSQLSVTPLEHSDDSVASPASSDTDCDEDIQEEGGENFTETEQAKFSAKSNLHPWLDLPIHVASSAQKLDKDFPVLSRDSSVVITEPSISIKEKRKQPRRPKKFKAASSDILGFTLNPRVATQPQWQEEEMDRELEKFEKLCEGDKISHEFEEPVKSEVLCQDSVIACECEKHRDTCDRASAATNSSRNTCAGSFLIMAGPSLREDIYHDPWEEEEYYYPASYDIWGEEQDQKQKLQEEIEREAQDTMADSWGFDVRAQKRLRWKKKWRIMKAHKQVKDKYCRDVNVSHGKKLFVKYRVWSRMPLTIGRSYQQGLSIKRIDKSRGLPWKGDRLDAARRRQESTLAANTTGANNNSTPGMRAAGQRHYPIARPRPREALSAYNADGDLPADLVNLMMALQDRDLTPEDYEILLRLDDRVAPKTLTEDVIGALKTDTACAEHCAETCGVCLEDYVEGQCRKHLPCGHVFHVSCIDTWLKNSSQNCPLDGVPIADS